MSKTIRYVECGHCGETVGTPAVTYPACTPVADYGPDGGETRPYEFNDVDDFDTAGNWVDANQFTQTNAEGVSDQEYRQIGRAHV